MLPKEAIDRHPQWHERLRHYLVPLGNDEKLDKECCRSILIRIFEQSLLCSKRESRQSIGRDIRMRRGLRRGSG
jgi:hypothetical protein